MPNLKLFLDTRHAATVEPLAPALMEGLRAQLCRTLSVPPAACQLAVVPVAGLPDQPAVNAELMVMPAAGRDRAAIQALAAEIRMTIAEATGLEAAVRIAFLDPQTYVVLK